MIKLRNICMELTAKRNRGSAHGRTKLLWDVSGEARRGEICVITGDNGCGKTTLLNLIVGRISRRVLTSGSVLYNGSPRHNTEWYKQVSYMEQNAVWFEGLSVKNILFYNAELSNTRTRRSKNMNLVISAMDSMNLSHLENATIDMLSESERRRVAIASLLTSTSDVLLLDEPTTGLDEEAAFEAFSIIRKYAIEQNKIVIVAINKADLVFVSLFDRIIFMSGGVNYYSGSISRATDFFMNNGISIVEGFMSAELMSKARRGIAIEDHISVGKRGCSESAVEGLERNDKGDGKTCYTENAAGDTNITERKSIFSAWKSFDLANCINSLDISQKGAHVLIRRNLTILMGRKYFPCIFILKSLLMHLILIILFLWTMEDVISPGPLSLYERITNIFLPTTSSLKLYRVIRIRIYMYLSFIVYFLSAGLRLDKKIIRSEVFSHKYTPTTFWISYVLSGALEAFLYALVLSCLLAFTCIHQHLDLTFYTIFFVITTTHSAITISYKALFYNFAFEEKMLGFLVAVNYMAPLKSLVFLKIIVENPIRLFLILPVFFFFPMFFLYLYEFIAEAAIRGDEMSADARKFVNEIDTLFLAAGISPEWYLIFLIISCVLLIIKGLFSLWYNLYPDLRLRLEEKTA